MKGNGEIRREAWGIVRSRWLGRIFATGGSLYLVVLFVSAVLALVYLDMGIPTLADFMKAKFEHWRQGLGYTVPSMAVFWRMAGASLFQQFVGCVFGAILLFGLAGLMLKAVRDDASGLFAATYGGFRRPFEVFWLMVLMNFRVGLWMLLFVFPGIVAIYRYRQAWYLKTENPDWGAVKCLAESGRMMKGHKWQAFLLDLSFLGWLVLIWLILGASVILGCGALAFCGALASCGGLALAAFVVCYYLAARAVFYRELLACARARDML